MELFGEYVARCVFSKARRRDERDVVAETWNLRDAALQKLALNLQEGERLAFSPGLAGDACAEAAGAQ